MAVQPPEIEAFPPTPQRKNKDTFANLFDDVISWFSRSVSKVGQACLSAYQNAVESEASANTAVAAAESAVYVAGATEWVSGRTYAKGACVWSPANGATYRRRAAGGGTVDPSADLANWAIPVQAGFSNMVVIRTTQTWKPPPGIVKAEITVVDGGNGGTASLHPSGASGSGGVGGRTSVSIRTISTDVTYTATVGAGGTRATSSQEATVAGGVGGASSFSGSGFTTLTSSNGDVVISGGFKDVDRATGGASFYSGPGLGTITDGVEIGQGGRGGRSFSYAGAAGAIIIRF